MRPICLFGEFGSENEVGEMAVEFGGGGVGMAQTQTLEHEHAHGLIELGNHFHFAPVRRRAKEIHLDAFGFGRGVGGEGEHWKILYARNGRERRRPHPVTSHRDALPNGTRAVACPLPLSRGGSFALLDDGVF